MSKKRHIFYVKHLKGLWKGQNSLWGLSKKRHVKHVWNTTQNPSAFCVCHVSFEAFNDEKTLAQNTPTAHKFSSLRELNDTRKGPIILRCAWVPLSIYKNKTEKLFYEHRVHLQSTQKAFWFSLNFALFYFINKGRYYRVRWNINGRILYILGPS